MTISAADVGSPEHLMELAREGRLSKEALVRFLAVDKRREYLAACAAIEKHYTEACTATGDPCLAGGCAVDGEICLQPVLSAGIEYARACGEAFIALFADVHNRADQGTSAA